MKRKKFSSRDIFVTVLCLFGFVLCIFLFWRDLNATLYRHGEEPVGTITFRHNTAQRRFIDRLIWDRLQNESPVFNGDIIRTANLSEATITFNHGDIVDIYSNTLIQVFADSRGTRIDFSDGGISVAAGTASGVVISSGDNRLAVDAGSIVRAASRAAGAFDLAVSEGAAVLENIQGIGRGVLLGAGSGLFLNEAGEAVAVPQAVALFPAPGARLLSAQRDGLPVEFRWNRLNFPSDVITRLEIAHDRSFSRIFFAANTDEDRLVNVVPDGTWFWRLYPVTADVPHTAVTQDVSFSRLTVAQTHVPALISPVHDHEFRFHARAPAVRFLWTSSAEAVFYNLEVADNPLMQNPAVNLRVHSGTGSQLSARSSPGEGRWYWRVTPQYRGGAAGISSEVRSFVIERGGDLRAPVLTSPAADAVINIAEGSRDTLFSWRRESEAVSYILRISANSNMGSPIIEESLTNTVFRYRAADNVITPGNWFWTVQQVGADGTVSPASEARAFSALQGELIQRAIFPPDNYTIADNLLSDMRFTWRTNLADTRFQVSASRDFDSLVIDVPAPLEAHTVRALRSGVYYWRITGSVGAQHRESSLRRIVVAESLPEPALNTPRSGGAYAQDGWLIVMRGQLIEFSWAAVPDADFYTFRMFRGWDTENAIEEHILSGTSIAVSADNFPDGAYTWTVQGSARESAASSRRTGLAARQTVNVARLQPVVLEHPRSGWEYAGLDASRRPGVVRWSSERQAFDTVFLIATDAQFTNVVHRAANVPREIRLPRLSPGTYFWTIQARTAEGIDISARTPFSFRVLPIPLLPLAQNRVPEDRHFIGPAQIRVSRSLEFSWGEVRGANGYIVTIFHNTGARRRTVIQTPVLRETRFAVEDIGHLGRGDFFWQVEAVYVTEGGFIEQRGQLRENSFTIDIPAPPPTQTRDSGVLYGR